MIDIHSHILPGVDDGARDITESIAMLQEAAEIGVTKIIATPHARKHVDWTIIEAAHRMVLREAGKFGIELGLGAEVLYDLLIRLAPEELQQYCFRGSKTILLEFHSQILPPKWEVILSELNQAGYQVIIAHPERYRFIREKPEIAMELRRYGAALQVDAESFTGRFWDGVNNAANRIVRDGLADYIASDAHDAAGYRKFGAVCKKVYKEG